MARNRKRAKAGKQKDNLHRQNVPGSLDHASGDADEAEAAIVAGADGQTEGAESSAGFEHPEELSVADFAELEDSLDQIEQDMEDGDREQVARDEEALDATVATMKPAAPIKQGLIGRTLTFLKSSWAELGRVQWPDRRQVGQATAVVLGFVVLAGLYLGLADVGAQELVNLII